MGFVFNQKEHKGIHHEHKVLLISLCFLLLLFSFSPLLLFSQISQGGKPASFNYPHLTGITEISLPAPELEAIRIEDDENENLGFPRRVGITVKADFDVIRDGRHDVLPGGVQVWRISVSCKNAMALSLYFDDFHLTDGCRMFVYDDERHFTLGAFTLANNRQNRLFSTELIPGDRLVLEINADPGVKVLPSVTISEVSFAYRDMPAFITTRSSSGDCEVNINCPEGDNWQYQKHGVAKIYVRENSGFFWCTGALLNNTDQNNEPLFLTANHCGAYASEEDLAQWVFYFNYEAPGCENPVVTPGSNTLTGALKLANASTSGSDFLLLRLADEVPLNYEPYFNGWSAENIASPRGVTIHHPAGDIKKISTYIEPLQSSSWLSTPGTHWQVYWTETESGWGVTEGGSSGSPLFDNTGKIIGSLTGGQAACEPNGSGPGTGPDMPDYYGKFSYSWDQNSSEPAGQLKYWLDPANSGIITLNGKYADLTAAFLASKTLILVDNTITFTNQSSGLPISWEWSFEGGSPSSYQGSQPVDVTYHECGLFDVRLIVSDGSDYDTLLLKDYIEVVGEVYPNPTTGLVNIFLELESPSKITIEVFNIMGQKVLEEQLSEQTYQKIPVNLSLLSAGVYTIRIQLNQRYVFARVLVK